MAVSRKFIVFHVAIIYFFMTANQLFARRIQTPRTPFMEKLLESLEEDIPIEEAVQPDFFAKNWESLEMGIRISFREDTFLEIRKSEDGILVLQLFGILTPKDKVNLQIIQKNIAQECSIRSREREYSIAFLDVSGKKIDRKEIEGAYSIISLSAEDFALFVKDIRSGGIDALPTKTIRMIDEFSDMLNVYIKYGLIDISSLPTNRGEFIELLHKALEEMSRDIIRDEEIMEIIEEKIFSVIDLLEGKHGEIIFRKFYHDVLKPCNHSLKSQYTLRDLATNGFAQVSNEVLRHGILIEFSPVAFIEFRIGDEIGVINFIGVSLSSGLSYLGMVAEKFRKLCEENKLGMVIIQIVLTPLLPKPQNPLASLDIGIIEGATALPIEPLRDAFGITHLSEREFSILVKDIKVGGTSSGYFGVREKLIDFIASMYDDLINYEFKRLDFKAKDLFMDKIRLFSFIEALIKFYEELITKNKTENGIILSGELIPYKKIEERINRYKEYLRALFSEEGNIIYRIFYHDFLRSDPWVARIIEEEL